MPVDNEIYNRLSSTWWDEQGFLNILRTAANPGRFGYFREVLLKQVGVDPAGKKALDVGCGGGLLAEEFARLGCQVTGIDPSEPSLATARAHARQSGLDIEYRVGVGEALPFADEAFDLVYCCDVLEHVNDLAQVLAEISRVLRGGVSSSMTRSTRRCRASSSRSNSCRSGNSRASCPPRHTTGPCSSSHNDSRS